MEDVRQPRLSQLLTACRYVANKVGRVVSRTSGLGEMGKSKPPIQNFSEQKVPLQETVTGDAHGPGPDVVKRAESGRLAQGHTNQDSGGLSPS